MREEFDTFTIMNYACIKHFGKLEEWQMAQHLSKFSFTDRSGEKSAVTIYNGPVTAITIAGFLTAFGLMKDAIEGITLGELATEEWVGDRTLVSNDLPASTWAQRELKWLVRYRNTSTEQIYTLEIPCPDMGTVVMLDGTDKADLAQTPMSVFVTQFESFAKAPDNDAQSVEVLEVRMVGRNI